MLLVSYSASYAGKLLLRTCVTALFIRISQMTLETLPNVVLDAVVERAGFGHGWRLDGPKRGPYRALQAKCWGGDLKVESWELVPATLAADERFEFEKMPRRAN